MAFISLHCRSMMPRAADFHSTVRYAGLILFRLGLRFHKSFNSILTRKLSELLSFCRGNEQITFVIFHFHGLKFRDSLLYS